MQAALFWISGGAFFALQLGMLLYLLYASPAAGLAESEGRRRRVEVVWTLVPASLFVAVVLMVSGFTGASWSRVRTAHAMSCDVDQQMLRAHPGRYDLAARENAR